MLGHSRGSFYSLGSWVTRVSVAATNWLGSAAASESSRGVGSDGSSSTSEPGSLRAELDMTLGLERRPSWLIVRSG